MASMVKITLVITFCVNIGHIGVNGVYNFVGEKYTLPDTLINKVVRTSREVRLTVTTASKKKGLKKLVA